MLQQPMLRVLIVRFRLDEAETHKNEKECVNMLPRASGKPSKSNGSWGRILLGHAHFGSLLSLELYVTLVPSPGSFLDAVDVTFDIFLLPLSSTKQKDLSPVDNFRHHHGPSLQPTS